MTSSDFFEKYLITKAFNVPFVVFLELSWYESYRIGTCPCQLWSQDLEPALRHLNNLRRQNTHLEFHFGCTQTRHCSVSNYI